MLMIAIGLISFFNQIDWDDLKHCVMYYLVFKDLIKRYGVDKSVIKTNVWCE